VDIAEKLDLLLDTGRTALDELNATDNDVGRADKIAAVRFSEGTLVGFLDALILIDPGAARASAPQIEAFISEATAARQRFG
jgi:hypothetical protein